MGSAQNWLMVCVVVRILLWPLVEGSQSYSRDSLDSSLYDYASKNLLGTRTGKLYNVSLPAKFAGMEVSAVRLRARALWKNGANYGSFAIPPSVLPFPFVKRVDVIHQNLGNWSSSYYNVPNHTFVAPVIGFLAYDPNRSSRSYGLIQLEIIGNGSFSVQFPNVERYENESVKCVRFDTNGTMEFSSMTVRSSCVVRKQGHISVVIPYEPKGMKRKPWMVGVGIAAGVVGLVLLVVVGVVISKWMKGKMIEEMESQAETSVGLDTIWIGRSRMPFAPCIRTQPVLETSSLP